MAPREEPAHLQLQRSSISQRVQLTYKLFLLENARNTLEQELRRFANKAYEEVQSFLNSSPPSSVFSELTKTLDVKCQAIAKLSALLKNLTVEPRVCVQPPVKNGVRTSQHQTLKDVLKFGPMLQSSLMASSVAKAVQVLGATLIRQHLKFFETSLPAAAVQQEDTMCISSSFNSTGLTPSSPCSLKAEEQQVVFEEKSQPDAAIVAPAISHSCEIGAERPQLLLPPIQAVLLEIGGRKPVNTTPVLRWGCEGDVQVQHQKQTSAHLLHFLREKAKNMGTLEVTVTEWTKSTYTSVLPQLAPPTVKIQRHQFAHVGTDDALPPKTLHTNTENRAPVFRVKRAESSGCLIYSCVIATETELWDIGDIFTEVVRGDPLLSPLEGEDCQNVIAQAESSSVNIDLTTQIKEPEHENSSADAKVPKFNSMSIPEFNIRRFEEAEVVVSHIVSPGNFYIQHADSPEKLQALCTDSWKAGSSYAEQNRIPDIGTQVMGWFPQQEKWCRAQVMKICGVSRDKNAMCGAKGETSIKVEVKRLDHGDTACLSMWNMKELALEMALLPLQAVQVSLANVMPANGRDWSEEAVGWFKTMVHNRTLYARLYPQGSTVTVELFLEKGKLGAMRRGASLSLRLAQNGHAKHNKLKNAGLLKRSAVQLKMHKQDSDWEKYLISCYTQSKKCPCLHPVLPFLCVKTGEVCRDYFTHKTEPVCPDSRPNIK